MSYRSTPVLVLGPLLLSLLAGCSADSGNPFALGLPTGAASGDSLRGLATPTTFATLSVPLVLEAAGGFRVTFRSRECAAQGNTVALVSPISFTLTTSGCQSPTPPFSWPTFDGPFPAGTEIRFTFTSGFTGQPGGIQVSGSYPTWIVAMEDGFDNDFNDLVFEVSAFAEAGCPADAAFSDADVLAGLEDLWANTNYSPDGPVEERREQYGYIVEQGESFEFVNLELEAPDPCSVSGVIDPPAGTVGWVHTHPFADQEVIPPGVCSRFPEGGTYRRGVSNPDKVTGGIINDELGRDVPGYIIDPSGVIRFSIGELDGTPVIESQQSFDGCVSGPTG